MTRQIVGFLAAGLTYATAIVNTLVYSPDPAKEASAAGFILLSMVMVCPLQRSPESSRGPHTLTVRSDRMDDLLWLHPSSHASRLH